MSNLRSDSRYYASNLPLGESKTLIERLCHQIDAVEECWFAANREAETYRRTVELFDWMCNMGCTVQRNSTIGQPRWGCLNVDGIRIGSGWSPVDAIDQAKKHVERNSA